MGKNFGVKGGLGQVKQQKFAILHSSLFGEMVRSKSEVIIADQLANHDFEYGYEQPLTINGVTKYPDFTIEDMDIPP